MQITNKQVAVVTGAASGLGRGLAEALAKRGCRLVLADIQADALQQVATQLRQAGAELTTQVTDVASASAVQALAEHAFAHFGRVDLLFNNAGVLCSGASWELDHAAWSRVLGVNLWGVINALHAFMPRLLEQPGGAHVVNIASLAGVTSGAWVAPYTVSKHGVVALSECLAAEMQALGKPIAVSVACPAAISTDIASTLPTTPSGHGSELNAHLRSLIGQAMAPEHAAQLILSGVEADELWIFPHEEARSAAQRRLQRLTARRQPAVQESFDAP